MITAEQLKEWRALADAATPGPWEAYTKRPEDLCVFGADGDSVCGKIYSNLGIDANRIITAKDNADFIATAREAVPRLEQEVRRLRAQLAAIRATAAPIIEFERMSSAGTGQPQNWQIGLTDSGAKLTASGIRALADALKEFP